MNTPQTIVILGGGVGGLIAARELRRLLPREHRVVVIDKQRDHLFAPSLLWLLVGQRVAHTIQRPLKQLERFGIDVLCGDVEKIDPLTREVTVSGEVMAADHLVVALGAELAPETIPGLKESGHNFYTLAGADSLRSALTTLQKGRVVVMTAAPAYKCPAAPYEAAMLIDAMFTKASLRKAVSIEVYAAEAGPMGVAGPEMSAAVRQLLAERNIDYHPEHQVASVDVLKKQISFGNGAQANFDVLAFVPPHRAPRVVRESALASDTGWVSVDRNTLQTKFANVFALGDVVSIPLSLGKPLPKAGVFAHAEAEVVAQNLAATILGTEPTARFTGHGECFVEVGNGRAGRGGGNFFAEPKPVVAVHEASTWNHWAKVLFEKDWLWRRL